MRLRGIQAFLMVGNLGIDVLGMARVVERRGMAWRKKASGGGWTEGAKPRSLIRMRVCYWAKVMHHSRKLKIKGNFEIEGANSG